MEGPHPDSAAAVIRIVATTPLRRAGILRILDEAGLGVSTDVATDNPDLTVRSADDLATSSPIEMTIGANDVQLRLVIAPDAQTWQAIAQLTEVLLRDMTKG